MSWFCHTCLELISVECAKWEVGLDGLAEWTTNEQERLGHAIPVSKTEEMAYVQEEGKGEDVGVRHKDLCIESEWVYHGHEHKKWTLGVEDAVNQEGHVIGKAEIVAINPLEEPCSLLGGSTIFKEVISRVFKISLINPLYICFFTILEPICEKNS